MSNYTERDLTEIALKTLNDSPNGEINTTGLKQAILKKLSPLSGEDTKPLESRRGEPAICQKIRNIVSHRGTNFAFQNDFLEFSPRDSSQGVGVLRITQKGRNYINSECT